MANKPMDPILGGGFKYSICLSSSLFGEDSHFDEHIFQMGWNRQLENVHRVSQDVFFQKNIRPNTPSIVLCFIFLPN